ncbi:helix-turn-helix domain-containing protein [Oceanobacillus timonensis]|uniref:helix-turn-helix domain-containing protein n=1 Tax=Oceanobacillus timonensis TaxID=1926285 RepID=UPI0009BAF111|nr:helix-turn-helix transcriptional regulator [Oceanobacillus timonensis]
MDLKSIGNNIRIIRKLKGFTQQELGDKVGITLQSLSKIERGINYPTFQNLEKIIQILDVTPNELFAKEFKMRGSVENEIIKFMEKERTWNLELKQEKYESNLSKESWNNHELNELRKYIKEYIDSDERKPEQLHSIKSAVYGLKLSDLIKKYDDYLSFDLFGEKYRNKDKSVNPYVTKDSDTFNTNNESDINE